MPAAEGSRNDLTGGFRAGLIERISLRQKSQRSALAHSRLETWPLGLTLPTRNEWPPDPSSRSRQLTRPAPRRSHPRPSADRHQHPPAWTLSREPLLIARRSNVSVPVRPALGRSRNEPRTCVHLSERLERRVA